MKSSAWVMGLVVALTVRVAECNSTATTVTHRQFQAINEKGEQTYKAGATVTLEGILLNNPADMLDPTADYSVTEPFNMSAQWQIFFQGEGADHAGTAVWMGQLYNNLPWVAPNGGYLNAEWIAEMNRLNAARFTPGDRIRVTGYFLSYDGKLNINEQHNKNPDHDFVIEVVDRGAGLPRPEAVSLVQLKDENNKYIFDPNREHGCEYYQARLIKVENVWFADANNWGPNGLVTITDGVRTFPVKLGRGNGIYAGSNNLDEPFDVIGIMDQESSDLKSGYRLYVMNYDGNGRVLAGREHRQADRPGDVNLDGVVDFVDFAKMAEDWLGVGHE